MQNSNDPPWNAAWPDTLDPSPYESEIPADRVSLRMARGIRMLSDTRKISFEQLIADKWSTRSELADRILPDLIEAAQRYGDDLPRQAAEVLAHWDRCTDADSRGALLFLNWSDRQARQRLRRGRLRATVRSARAPDHAAGSGRSEGSGERMPDAARDMLANYGAFDRPWGSVMRLRLGAVDLPASGGPGRIGVFNAIDYAPVNGTRAANFGASYTAVVSFDDPARAKCCPRTAELAARFDAFERPIAVTVGGHAARCLANASAGAGEPRESRALLGLLQSAAMLSAVERFEERRYPRRRTCGSAFSRTGVTPPRTRSSSQRRISRRRAVLSSTNAGICPSASMAMPRASLVAG